MIPEELVERAKAFTDSSLWCASWHWQRDQHGRLTREGAEKILRDLDCKDEAAEIHEAIAAIRRRYELAKEIKHILFPPAVTREQHQACARTHVPESLSTNNEILPRYRVP